MWEISFETIPAFNQRIPCNPANQRRHPQETIAERSYHSSWYISAPTNLKKFINFQEQENISDKKRLIWLMRCCLHPCSDVWRTGRSSGAPGLDHCQIRFGSGVCSVKSLRAHEAHLSITESDEWEAGRPSIVLKSYHCLALVRISIACPNVSLKPYGCSSTLIYF